MDCPEAIACDNAKAMSNMSLVGKHAGMDRHVVMECILVTHSHLAQRTTCDMENQDLIRTT